MISRHLKVLERGRIERQGRRVRVPCDPSAVAGAFVYLLRCGDGSLYCGWTTDIPGRLKQHQAGAASRYTRARLPVELAWSTPMASRSAAMREEARIKRLSRAEKLGLIGAP